jgi:hypothetical protein
MDNLLAKKEHIQYSFIELVKYFGEDIEFKNSDKFFTTVNDFKEKFEVKSL